MEKLVLVGNGMAGVRCIEEIIKNDPTAFQITVFGAENHVNYNRILLSSILQGNTTFQNITLNDNDWYKQHHINLFTGETVIKIDVQCKVIYTDKKRAVPFDKLILATGSVPFLLPIPGADKEGVMPFRTFEDCRELISQSKKYRKAVVIGGGLLGLEAARGLLNLGMEVEVVHLAKNIMERQLDSEASEMLQTELEKQGMKFLLEKETQELIGDKRVEGLRFQDGTETETDLVVMAAGVRPNIQLAKESGIETNRAIIVNDFLQTNIPYIYAVGECVEHRGTVYGLVKPLYEQGKILARHICGIPSNGYKGSTLATQLKISGVDVFSVGQFFEGEKSKSIKLYDELENVYKKLVFQENKLVGAVLFGNSKGSSRLQDLIVKQRDISDLEKISLLQSPNELEHSVAAMGHNDLICNCNSVSKGVILESVLSKGLKTVEEVKTCTKASGTCGSCKPLVSNLLSYIHSDDFNEEMDIKTMCGCTDLTEDEVVHEIQQQSLSSAEQVMDILNWKNKQGCPVCRSALNYYLGMIYPELREKKETRKVNIKTCIDEDICDCNKQDSIKLALLIKKRTDALLTPSRLKIGISACVHNGADSTTKDIGLIKIDRGWEMYVGGSSGRDVRAGELLCVAATDEEAVEITIALIQYYRGTANYLERTWQWIERLGLVHIREVLFEQELRQQLLEQLDMDTEAFERSLS